MQPFSTNEIKKVVKTPKLYFLDTGLAAYLTRWLTSETLATGAMSGHFFETFVISEILKSYTNAGLPANLYYLRDSNKQEIDLLIFQNNTIYPIEIKQKTNPTLTDIQNFTILNHIKKIKVADGAVICLAERILPLDSKNRIVPIWAI